MGGEVGVVTAEVEASASAEAGFLPKGRRIGLVLLLVGVLVFGN